MEEVSIIGIDLLKRSLQVHSAKADRSVAGRDVGTQAEEGGRGGARQ